MSGHSALPWNARDGKIRCALENDRGGYIVGSVNSSGTSEGIANAALIVSAVNSHADLLAALVVLSRSYADLLAALEAIEAHCVNERGLTGQAHADDGKRVREQARAAIARAKA